MRDICTQATLHRRTLSQDTWARKEYCWHPLNPEPKHMPKKWAKMNRIEKINDGKRINLMYVHTSICYLNSDINFHLIFYLITPNTLYRNGAFFNVCNLLFCDKKINSQFNFSFSAVARTKQYFTISSFPFPLLLFQE